MEAFLVAQQKIADLSGHTGGSRLPLFTRRPAPIKGWAASSRRCWAASSPRVVVDQSTTSPNPDWCYCLYLKKATLS
jgi:hypothetical protein